MTSSWIAPRWGATSFRWSSDGLIAIEPMASDRRSKELHLTKAGDKRFQAAREGWIKAQTRFESAFGSKRTTELRELLRAVVASEFADPQSRARAAT